MKAVFLDYATISHDDIDVTPLTQCLPGLEFYDTSAASELAGRLADAEVLFLNKITLDAQLLRGAPHLKLICAAGTGVNNIDADAARELGIGVCNIQAYCTQSVVQHVFAVILSLTHHLQAYERLLLDGAWRGTPQYCLLDYPIRELSDKVIGIVGYGDLGRGVATVARAFGMHVLLAERPGRRLRDGRLELHELLPRVDILSLHCPLTEVTQNLIGAAELALMKPDALLVNTARGGLVDADALARALCAGQLGGAGIDVLAVEPPADGNALLEEGIPNLIVTPHTAWAAVEARQRAINEMAANVRAWQAGERRNRVV